VTAEDVYRTLWRHKFLIVALTAACVAATWFVTSQQTRIYKASTLVRIQQRNPGDALSSLQAGEFLAQTYAAIIGSGALDDRVRALSARRRLVSEVQLSGEPVANLGLLWISARSTDPQEARVVANTTPGALEGFIRESGTLRDEVVAVKAATTPGSPTAPNTPLNVGVALVLALIFNSALVLLFEAFRDRLPETEELEGALGYPVLAAIPTLRLRPLKKVEAERDEDTGALAVNQASDGQGTSRNEETAPAPEKLSSSTE
jgi:capsular polysaccharide biosynthesis protein